MRQPNGSGDWDRSNELFLDSGSTKSLIAGDVFVIINGASTVQALIENADLIHENSSPMSFNGNDPVGLFKNGDLLDIIGDFDGGSQFFAQDMTLRRKGTISKANTRFDTSEWDILASNTFDGIGSHTSTLSSKKDSFQVFKMFPNPVYGDQVNFIVNDATTITIYNVLGKISLHFKNHQK